MYPSEAEFTKCLITLSLISITVNEKSPRVTLSMIGIKVKQN